MDIKSIWQQKYIQLQHAIQNGLCMLGIYTTEKPWFSKEHCILTHHKTKKMMVYVSLTSMVDWKNIRYIETSKDVITSLTPFTQRFCKNGIWEPYLKPIFGRQKTEAWQKPDKVKGLVDYWIKMNWALELKGEDRWSVNNFPKDWLQLLYPYLPWKWYASK